MRRINTEIYEYFCVWETVLKGVDENRDLGTIYTV